ncbi:acylneuraminate cytidylyltransferase [Pelagibacterium xiamenense]|uniref:acylneuraminate cytidylyltransferase n=1 Tax=Pelagibacterium xiamenense TaxID=2901140 RepID=UPI001E5903A4|nr:acylneuraminate cytidylyltransferase [Pelagibacterium xiamenense]MCD7061403.1 acylneuraminate cytidylyltransferase [Pelagibacterium xiamenense]
MSPFSGQRTVIVFIERRHDMAEKTIAVLLARGGSKGVPGKNLRKIGGRSLVARSVLAARAAAQVGAVYVSTDDAEIANETRRFGGRVIDRPAELSGDTASSESGWLHALAVIREQHPDVARLVFLQCTSPFTTGADIDGCLTAMNDKNAACALTVVEDHSFLWGLSSDGLGVGVNHDETRQRQRRQDLAPAFKENGAVYCVRVDDFERVGRRFCGPVALYPVDHPPVEIDSLADLALCNAIAAERGDAGGLSAADIAKIKVLVMDFDGVHTDDTAIVDQDGVESVRVSRRDGMGIEMLRKSGRFALLILSKEKNHVVMRRAEKLQIACLQARDDKVAALSEWLDGEGLVWDDVLFVGNDRNDLPAIRKAGFSACPRDAHASVVPFVDWIIPHDGGRGAVRAVADRLLADDAKQA